MFLPAPGEGGSFTPPPAGTHTAICYRVIDLGTQKVEWQGQTKQQHKIMVSWELPEELMDDGKPYTITQRYTWSMSDKAVLRHHLESWRGAAFALNDFGPSGFDIRNILGKPCILNIVHKTVGEKTYANIGGVMKPMKGMNIPPQSNPSVYLWLHPSRWDVAVFNALSPKLQDVIRNSPEYREMMAGPRDDDIGHDDPGENPPAPLTEEGTTAEAYRAAKVGIHVPAKKNGNGGGVAMDPDDAIPFAPDR